MRERMGQLAGAVEAWEKLVQTLPDRAYLALDRLERAYHRAGSPQRFGDLCARLIDQNPQDWRTRLALSRHLAADGRHRKAFELLLDALPHNPHGLAIHHEVWKALLALDLDQALVRQYIEPDAQRCLLDPHVPALPLQEHGITVAVPAVPRMEYLRRGADVAGQRFGGGGVSGRNRVAGLT